MSETRGMNETRDMDVVPLPLEELVIREATEEEIQEHIHNSPAEDLIEEIEMEPVPLLVRGVTATCVSREDVEEYVEPQVLSVDWLSFVTASKMLPTKRLQHAWDAKYKHDDASFFQ